jgi:hypothetical protein
MKAIAIGADLHFYIVLKLLKGLRRENHFLMGRRLKIKKAMIKY